MAARQLTLIRWIVATDLVLGLIRSRSAPAAATRAERRRRVSCQAWPGAGQRDGKLQGAAPSLSGDAVRILLSIGPDPASGRAPALLQLNRSLTRLDQIPHWAVHATVGVRAADWRRGAQIPRIAWTIEREGVPPNPQ
jgi:hypothetical protein